MRAVIRWVLRLVAALAVLLLLVVSVTAGRVWYTARQDQRPQSDGIAVLGASQYDGRPSEVLAARLRHARQLYLQGVAPRILTLGGGREGDRYTEADAGKLWLTARDVPAADVIAIGVGDDTLTSIDAMADVYAERGWTSVVLVTDPWHEFRAREMAEHAGMTAYTSPTRTGPVVQSRVTQARYIARETIAYLYWRLFHRSRPET